MATLLFGVITMAAGLVVAFNRAHMPSEAFWTGLEAWVMGSIVVVTCLPFLQSLSARRSDRKKARLVELENTLHEILAGVLIALTETAGADWKRTGVQVFRVRPWWVFGEIQSRAARLRLAHIAPSGIKWRRGKGLIGKCWETRGAVSKNLQQHFAPYRNWKESEWNSLPQTFEKYGFTYEEFKKVGDKYGLVVAFPLTRADKYIGCVTVDMPPECSSVVNEAKILETLSAAAPSIAAVVEKAN